ncbi:MAG: sigma-70 family RNA polymerase sigma factor [Pirellulales bacterium]|nr:sigma-70 family RNA polymerase sigma factor [Pirellulales bacterium]
MTPKDLFEILVREHADMLTVYLRCVVRDPAQIDDLFQETMMTAWRNLEKFDRERPFGPWLRGIAAKLVLAQRRREARRPLLCDELVLAHLEARHASLAQMPGDTLDQKLEMLRDCLEHLPVLYRDAVELRYREGLRGPRLAARLEISIEALKKRLQRGRARLLDCLERKMAPLERTA